MKKLLTALFLLAAIVPASPETLSISSTSGGGTTIGTTPITGGADKQVLFEDGGVFGGDAGLVYNKTTDALTVLGSVTAASSFITGGGGIGLYSDPIAVTGLISYINSTALGLNSGSALQWAESTVGGAYDLVLRRDAANTLALRNGPATPQAFNIYNTWSDAGNWERVQLYWAGNRFNILANAAGTGSLRAIGLNGRWNISTAGHFLAEDDNTYDIGASGATRPRSGYFGENVIAGLVVQAGQQVNVGSYVVFGAGGSGNSITGGTDGQILLRDAAGTSWNLIQFGGGSSSFPALKRSTTTLQVRLADDSAFTAVQGKITTDTAYTAGVVTETGYIVLFDSTGTAYKVNACTGC